MIYVFRQYDSDKQIIIYAESYIEAKETLFDLNPWADKTYNILEYKMYQIDYKKFYDVLKIDESGFGVPRILSKKEYEILRDNKVILDEQFKNLHNTKVLTKQFVGENTNLLSTEEFVDKLKNYADSIDKTKKSIYQMMDVVGDIWKLTYTPYRYTDVNGVIKDTASIYGLSRRQILKTYNNQQHKQGYGKLIIEPIIQPQYKEVYELENNDFSPKDIDEYNTLVTCMKKYHIKKFPFDTQEQDMILLKEKCK